jgi:hypothetical protein
MWFLLVSACIKPAGPVQAPSPLPLRIVSVVSSYADDSVTPGGKVLTEELVAEVASHALQPAPVTELGPVVAARSTEARLAALGQAPVLLVETAPRFSSQMAGRYRWTVDVVVSLAGVEPAEHREFSVPVALVYDHERELAAADAAAPAIARQVRAVLDHSLSAP